MIMNKKCSFLLLLLVLLPGCGGNKKPRYSTAPVVASLEQGPEKAEYDEELGAYVVKDDDNKFSAASAAQEELSAASSEPGAGDMHNDSARYGFKPLFFEFDKYKIADLQPDQRQVLEHDANIAKTLAGKGYRLVLEGHACNSAGSTDYNMALSVDRATAVKEYLREKGVVGNIETVGRGASHLMVPSGTREQQAPNRRVEIYAYAADGGVSAEEPF